MCVIAWKLPFLHKEKEKVERVEHDAGSQQAGLEGKQWKKLTQLCFIHM